MISEHYNLINHAKLLPYNTVVAFKFDLFFYASNQTKSCNMIAIQYYQSKKH